jgi:hypothetical protein
MNKMSILLLCLPSVSMGSNIELCSIEGIVLVRIGIYQQAIRDCAMTLDLILSKECHWTEY